MKAVDTNILIRFLTQDDPVQFAATLSLFAAGPIWIAKTVLLETHWVLRSVHALSEDSIRTAFSSLLGLDNVQVEDGPAVVAALSLTSRGIGFADALHLHSRPPETALVSFDRTFVRRAQSAGVARVHELGCTP